MIAALLWSNQPCVGPKVARRHFTRARVTGSDGSDVVRIREVMVKGNEVIPILPEGEFIQVEHLQAGDKPICVELF